MNDQIVIPKKKKWILEQKHLFYSFKDLYIKNVTANMTTIITTNI